ncbi:MAG: hypothetical protein N3A65_07105 [candidate division WOR-3 bacterium]|nr:hypothetical protein [candidate division WOR-3 bacterium]
MDILMNKEDWVLRRCEEELIRVSLRKLKFIKCTNEVVLSTNLLQTRSWFADRKY